MKFRTFCIRNCKELARDPLTVFFNAGFPLLLLFLLSAIQKNIPVSMFEPEHLTPGITVFGLSFMTLFSASLIAKDRESAFLQRLYTTPLTAPDFIFGYALPILPTALLQSLLCYLAAVPLGLPLGLTTVYAVLSLFPAALFFTGLGLLCGSVFTVRQTGGIAGALVTNLCAFLSGIWFDLSLVGGVFETIAEVLPFVHAVELARAALAGTFDGDVLRHLLMVSVWAAVTLLCAVLLFLRQMKQN